MAVSDRRTIEKAELAARPISYLGHYYAAAKEQKVDLDHFNPYATILYIADAKDQIPVEAAKLFLDLSSNKKIPPWAIAQADIQLIRAAAK